MLKTLDEILETVTADGVHELTTERCKQVAREWAMQCAKLAVTDERDRHVGLVIFAKRCVGKFKNRGTDEGNELASMVLSSLQMAGYNIYENQSNEK